MTKYPLANATDIFRNNLSYLFLFSFRRKKHTKEIFKGE